jgi:hypothetical protein
VLIAQGRAPDHSLRDQLAAAQLAYVEIGDAKTGGRIGDAVHDAYAAVVALCATSQTPDQLAC